MLDKRLDFVDSLRGICALYIVGHHIWYELHDSTRWVLVHPLLQKLTQWLELGVLSVSAFIVISGFCLILPVVTTNSQNIPGGTWRFLVRRARRILPPYYAVMFLSLLLIALIPPLNRIDGHHWDFSLPALTKEAMVTHLFLLHNLSRDWAYKISHPLWSIAVEWQIYFFFALILMPLRRKFGIIAAVLLAIVLGLIPRYLFHVGDWTRPWYLGLFSLGMLSATIAFSNHPVSCAMRKKIPWMALIVIFTTIEICLVGKHSLVTADFVTALLLACILIWGVSASEQNGRFATRAVWTLLNSKPLIRIGIFSYSIYLIHAPVIALYRILLEDFFKLQPTTEYILLLIFGPLLSVTAGYLFFLAVEKRFLPKQKTIVQQDSLVISDKFHDNDHHDRILQPVD